MEPRRRDTRVDALTPHGEATGRAIVIGPYPRERDRRFGRADERAPAARLDGFIVQETVAGLAEVIVGARRDPQFGAVVMVGLGGIAVEILKDVALASAPVSAERARAMLDSLAASPLFTGARGRPPLDVDAVVEAVVRVSWLAADLGARLVDLEVNPLIVARAGAGAVAVDGRGSLANETHEEEPVT